MKTFPLDFVGATYKSRSREQSVQSTVNLYPEVIDSGRTQTALQSWPGCKAWYAGSGADRGMAVMANVLYKVSGSTLYSVDNVGTHTSIGNISGTNKCIFANDGTNLIIVSPGTAAYQYNGSTLSQITDVDYEQGDSVTYLNSQMIFDGTGGRFCTATVGDPDNISGLNFATAEGAPDDLVRVYAFREKVYMFGESTVETWYNSGSGNPPFDRINGGTMPVGLGALHSVANTDDFVYFLGDDKNVYRFSSFQAESVTPIGIAAILEGKEIETAQGFTLRLQGQNFYYLTLDDITLCYNENANAWFELSYGTDGARHLANSYAYCYGKHLVADYNNGNIYEWDLSTFTDNSAVILRTRKSRPVSAIDLGLPGQRLLMSRVELIMETGVGIATGQGSNPAVLFSVSTDGGKSFTNEEQVYIGRTGERAKVEWYHMASAYDFVIRVRMSDPVFMSIHGGAIDVEADGW